MNPKILTKECDHAKHMPTVTDEELKGLSSTEIRVRYPRFMGTCSDCGKPVILYASWMHYMAGDY